MDRLKQINKLNPEHEEYYLHSSMDRLKLKISFIEQLSYFAIYIPVWID